MDPTISPKSSETLDNLYDKLLNLYTKDYDLYVKESKDVKDEIQALKPPAPAAFRPYPKMLDPKFNEKIYIKKEFHRNILKPEYQNQTDYDVVANKKCSLTEFRLSNNQKFVKNFISPLTPYNGLLLLHGTGLGKTCSAISIAEQYLADTTVVQKKVLVILSSNIKENFKKQIFDITRYDVQTGTSSLCTGTKYPDMIIDKDIIPKEVLEKRINKLIRDRYQFVGYKELVGITSRLMDIVKRTEKNESKHKKRYEEKIKDMFSNRLIIVDEAHNLRMASEQGKKQISNTLMQILELAENSKLLMLSATPMFNNAKEIIWMINLMLTNDKRPLIKVSNVFDQNGRLTEQGKKTLIKASRGYISYMRGENPFSFPFRLYPSINGDPNVIRHFPSRDNEGETISEDNKIKFLELVGSDMSTYQKSVYDQMKKQVVIAEDDDDDENDGEASTNDLLNTLQIANIVYPSLSDDIGIKNYFGKTGFSNCFDKDKKGIRYKSNIKDKQGEFLRYDTIDKFAPKIKTILDYVIKSKGIVFIYSQYYGSGIWPLALALEHIGFNKYNSKNLGVDITVDNKFNSNNKTKAKPSYIIMSNDKDISPNNDQEIAMAKARANKDGDIIKVIIVSKVGTEGIDFKHIREIHVLEPWFNLNRIEQIIGRGIRTCSHMELPKDERNVTIYLHATKYSKEEESIDIKTYRVAENKQSNISQVQLVLKQNAIDCAVNKAALIYPKDAINMKIDIVTSQGKRVENYKVGDIDFSPICDFAKCGIQCAWEPLANVQKNVNASTFDPVFIMDDIALYKKYISLIYQNIKENTYEEILALLRDVYVNVEEDILSYALQEMVDSKYKFKNGDGRFGYLIYRGNTYIFQDSKYPTKLSREERQDIKSRNKLDVNVLIASKQKDQEQTNTKAKPNVNANIQEDAEAKPTNNASNANKKTAAAKKTKVKDNASIIEIYESLQKSLTYCAANSIPENIILESVVDRLTLQDIQHLLTLTSRSEVETKVYNAFIASPLFLKVNNMEYVYHHGEDTFYVLKDRVLKPVGPLDVSKNSLNAHRKELHHKHPDMYKGFIEVKKDANFKIRDNPAMKGYICHQTSSLSLDELKRRIIEIDPSILSQAVKKYAKRPLCDIYEFLLRRLGDKAFKRVYQKID